MKKWSWLLLLCSLNFLPQAFAASNEQLAAEILVYINQYRVQHGLSKLTMNPALTREAEQHSMEMANHRVPFGHDGFSQRMTHLHESVANSLSGAENVAYNYKTARIVVDGWIHSPGHRQNLMGHYNLTGIGIARDAKGRIYYTQMFLKADNPPARVQVITSDRRYRHGHYA